MVMNVPRSAKLLQRSAWRDISIGDRHLPSYIYPQTRDKAIRDTKGPNWKAIAHMISDSIQLSGRITSTSAIPVC